MIVRFFSTFLFTLTMSTDDEVAHATQQSAMHVEMKRQLRGVQAELRKNPEIRKLYDDLEMMQRTGKLTQDRVMRASSKPGGLAQLEELTELGYTQAKLKQLEVTARGIAIVYARDQQQAQDEMAGMMKQ